MRTKNYIDDFYYLFFGIYFIMCFALAILILILHTTTFNVVVAILGIVINLLGCFFFYVREYIFENDKIVVRVGCFTKLINYKDINDCYITQNNKLSYATSKKRIGLNIAGKDKHIFISPVKMDEVLIFLVNDTKKPTKGSKK